MPVYPVSLNPPGSEPEMHLFGSSGSRRGSTGGIAGMILQKPVLNGMKQSASVMNISAKDWHKEIEQSFKQTLQLKSILTHYCLQDYLPLLKDQEVDIDSLPLIRPNDLEELGIKPEDRRIFLSLIDFVKQGRPNEGEKSGKAKMIRQLR
jgi:hypothetical protein